LGLGVPFHDPIYLLERHALLLSNSLAVLVFRRCGDGNAVKQLDFY
jgi:hypothetical protein